VFVRTVESGARPSRAGIRAGDIIVKYNGESLSPANARRQLWQLIMETKVGTQVPLVVVRDGDCHGAREHRQAPAGTAKKR